MRFTALFFAWGLIFVEILHSSAQARINGCYKLLVKEMKSLGFKSRAERRRVLLPKLDFSSMRTRLNEAVKQKEDAFLPELIPDVRWAKTSVEEFSADVLLTGDLTPTEAVQFKHVTQLLRIEIQRLLNNPKGISYTYWRNVSEAYIYYVGLVFNFHNHTADKLIQILANGPDRPLYKLYSSSTKEPPRGPQSPDSAWILIPTARSISIRDINEWMAEGFLPVGMTDGAIGFDGSAPKVWSWLNLFEHDLVSHISGLGTRKTGISLTPQEFYAKFELFRDSYPAQEALLKKNLDVLWYYAFFESTWLQRPYGPSTLRWQMRKPPKYPGLEKTFLGKLMDRFGKYDIGEYYHGQLPDEASLLKAANLLDAWAREIEVQYALP